MEITSLTHATAKGRRLYQEDAYFVEKMSGGTLIGVFDGHGGDSASAFAKETLPYLVKSASESDINTARVIEQQLIALGKNMHDFRSGTTASVVFIPNFGDEVFTAVIGDSPIVIQTKNGPWVAPEHNARSNAKERQAAETRGGVYQDGYLWKDGDFSHGLQMSRALGDYHLKGVVVPDPEINIVPVEVGGFVLVGSDGLFDPSHVSFEKALKAVVSLPDAHDMVNYAVNVPTQDNVTAVLVKF